MTSSLEGVIFPTVGPWLHRFCSLRQAAPLPSSGHRRAYFPSFRTLMGRRAAGKGGREHRGLGVGRLTSSSGSVGGGGSVTLTACSPSTAIVGTTLTLTGTNFASGQAVLCGGLTMDNVSFVSSTSITADVPSGASGLVAVSVAGIELADAVTVSVYSTPNILVNASFEAGFDGFTAMPTAIGGPGGDPTMRIGRANDQAYSGSYSLKHDYRGSGFPSEDTDGDCWYDFGSVARVQLRFWFRKNGDVSGSGARQKVFYFKDTGGSQTCILNCDVNGQLSWFASELAGASVNIGSVISDNAWHSFEIDLHRNGGLSPDYQRAMFWIDDTLITHADGTQNGQLWASNWLYANARSNTNNLRFFQLHGNFINQTQIYWWTDRVAISTAGRIGP